VRRIFSRVTFQAPTRHQHRRQDHGDAPVVGAILGGPQVDGAGLPVVVDVMVPSALESLYLTSDTRARLIYSLQVVVYKLTSNLSIQSYSG
jgi:hypothetical protein